MDTTKLDDPDRGRSAPDTPTSADSAVPTLLLSAMVAVLAVVIAVALLAGSESSVAVALALAVTVVGVVALTALIAHQLADLGGSDAG